MTNKQFMHLNKGDKVIVTGSDESHNSEAFKHIVKKANNHLIATVRNFDTHIGIPTVIIDIDTDKYGLMQQSIMIQYVEKYKDPRDYKDSHIIKR